MAKDGTARGGARVGAGRKPKALSEKIETGNPGKRPLMVMELPVQSELTGEEMPPVKEYMKAKQRNGKDLCAEEIFKETWLWLKERGCERLVNTQLIEQYAMMVSRWIQCEECLSEFGLLAKHPTTGNAISSPYVSMGQQYMKVANQAWYQIFQVVKENCLTDYSGATPQDDVMERLLQVRKGMT